MLDRNRKMNFSMTGAGMQRAGIEIDYFEGNLETRPKGGLV